MKRTLTQKTLFSAVALAAAFVAQSASASVIITEWDYTVSSAFSNFAGTGGDGVITPSGSGLDGDPTTLSWGTNPNGSIATPQSSISIEGSVSSPPTILTGVNSVPGATFSHNNRVIPDGSNTLSSFNLRTQLDLTAVAPASEAGQAQQVGPIVFNSRFTETLNAEPCTTGSVSVCDDLFVLDNAAALAVLGEGRDFTLDDVLYTVFIDVAGLNTLNDDQCAAANAGSGCIGFQTEEGQNNQFATTVRIEALRQVPEPGSLALFALGLGLLSFGYASRRRWNV